MFEGGLETGTAIASKNLNILSLLFNAFQNPGLWMIIAEPLRINDKSMGKMISC